MFFCWITEIVRLVVINDLFNLGILLGDSMLIQDPIHPYLIRIKTQLLILLKKNNMLSYHYRCIKHYHNPWQ